jgi:hypothetical protein
VKELPLVCDECGKFTERKCCAKCHNRICRACRDEHDSRCLTAEEE